jgi:hypothetical protein
MGPLADVKEWLNKYKTFARHKVATIDAASVRMDRCELQIDLGLDDYASQLELQRR